MNMIEKKDGEAKEREEIEIREGEQGGCGEEGADGVVVWQPPRD